MLRFGRTGTSPGKSVDVAEAAKGFAGRCEARPARVGACLSVARDPRIDQFRAFRGESLRPQVPLFHGARAEILDQHVAFHGQTMHQLTPTLFAQIHRYAALVAAHAAPPPGGAVLVQLAPVAKRVAAARRFHLDHLGAEVAEHAASERTCDELAQLQHANTVKGAGFTHGGPRNGLCTGRDCKYSALVLSLRLPGPRLGHRASFYRVHPWARPPTGGGNVSEGVE